jgi:hypothetical protein
LIYQLAFLIFCISTDSYNMTGKIQPIITAAVVNFCLIFWILGHVHMIYTNSVYVLSDKMDTWDRDRARWPDTKDFSSGGLNCIHQFFCFKNIVHPSCSQARKPFIRWYGKGACQFSQFPTSCFSQICSPFSWSVLPNCSLLWLIFYLFSLLLHYQTILSILLLT